MFPLPRLFWFDAEQHADSAGRADFFEISETFRGSSLITSVTAVETKRWTNNIHYFVPSSRVVPTVN